jgi:hypothetical protein
MTLVDGEGKPIPPDSWGGDLDPNQQTRCRECGVPIPFGAFCPAHLEAARTKNEEVMAKLRAERGIDPEAPIDPTIQKSHHAPGREIDMDAEYAAAQERAQAIVTPDAEIPPAHEHMPAAQEQVKPVQAAQTHEPPPQQPAEPIGSSLVLPAAAADRVGLTRRSDDFLIGQAVMWLSELRTLAEDGKVRREAAAEILQLTAELTYALAGLLR